MARSATRGCDGPGQPRHVDQFAGYWSAGSRPPTARMSTGMCSTRLNIGANHAQADQVRHRGLMASQRVPGPKELKAAAQAAAGTAQSVAETAQAVASGAMRIPPATLQIVGELPDLIENLAIATERLNTAIDRAERYLALADPAIRTMDALLPQLEALVATGNDVYRAVSSAPGIATLGRFANRGSDSGPKDNQAKGRPPRSKS